VFGPDAVPITQLPTVATPLAFVVCTPPVTLPPPVATANVTATPPTGLLNASLAITLGAVATCAATVALWLFPATIANCVAGAGVTVSVACAVFPPVSAVIWV
jgi:hypothetical protein